MQYSCGDNRHGGILQIVSEFVTIYIEPRTFTDSFAICFCFHSEQKPVHVIGFKKFWVQSSPHTCTASPYSFTAVQLHRSHDSVSSQASCFPLQWLAGTAWRCSSLHCSDMEHPCKHEIETASRRRNISQGNKA